MIPRSLRARVTAVGVITLALVLSVGGWLTVRGLGAALRGDIQAQNEEVLDDLAAQVADGVDPRTIPVPIGSDGTEFLILDEAENLINFSFLAPSSTSPLLVDGGVAAVIPGSDTPLGGIPGAGGPLLETMVFESEADLVAFLLAVESGGVVGPGAVGSVEVIDAGFGSTGDWFETRRPIEAPSGQKLTLVALSPFEVLSRSIDRLAWALVFIVPLVVLLGGLALWFAVGSALQPVQRITDEARRIAPSNSGDRLPVPDSSDEIADLTMTLNDMLDRLDAGLIRQRQFVSDASHELRSPLTTVKGAAELVAGNPNLSEEIEPTVETLGRGVARLETVLDDLTELAVAGVAVAKTDVDLADVINSEVEAVVVSTDVVIDTSGVPVAAVAAHEIRLGRAVRNLLENAVRHAESDVRVAATIEDNTVRVTVDDDGPGIPEADRGRVFERFVRLDDARTRSGGGSGLGLALVSAIASEHGGTVTCGVSPLGGARFELSFPSAVRADGRAL
ncbi:MAG: ATP-binding protein [Acidimicrobiales bacterium]